MPTNAKSGINSRAQKYKIFCTIPPPCLKKMA